MKEVTIINFKLPVIPKRKVVTGAFLVALLLFAVALTPIVFGEPEATVQNITVDTAYDMITGGSFPDLVILDVRNQSEYNLGHLHDAILVPFHELEPRIYELEEYCENRGYSKPSILNNKICINK